MLFQKKSSAPFVQGEKPAAQNPLPPSYLADDLKIVGTIMSTGAIVVDCQTEGNLYGARITIGDHGFVHGDVIAQEITICGRVAGRLRATIVRLGAHGSVDGDVDFHTLSVDLGASLNGNCRCSDNPLAGIVAHVPEKLVSSSDCASS